MSQQRQPLLFHKELQSGSAIDQVVLNNQQVFQRTLAWSDCRNDRKSFCSARLAVRSITMFAYSCCVPGNRVGWVQSVIPPEIDAEGIPDSPGTKQDVMSGPQRPQDPSNC